MAKAAITVSVKTVVLTVCACVGAILLYVGLVYGIAVIPGFLLLFVILALAIWLLTILSPH